MACKPRPGLAEMSHPGPHLPAAICSRTAVHVTHLGWALTVKVLLPCCFSRLTSTSLRLSLSCRRNSRQVGSASGATKQPHYPQSHPCFSHTLALTRNKLSLLYQSELGNTHQTQKTKGEKWRKWAPLLNHYCFGGLSFLWTHRNFLKCLTQHVLF